MRNPHCQLFCVGARNTIIGVDTGKFQFVAHVPSRVLGTGTLNKKRSQKGKGFQKLKICDRRMLPALTNSRKPELRS